jgi:hypothetical protein
MDAPIYDRARLGTGDLITGPAILTQLDATTLRLAAAAPATSPKMRPGVDRDINPEGQRKREKRQLGSTMTVTTRWICSLSSPLSTMR